MNPDYPALRNLQSIISERTNRIVLWVGAGVSVPARLPTWSQLRRQLCVALEHKADASQAAEKESLRQRAKFAHEQADLWLAFQILKDSLGLTSYRHVIRESLAQAESCLIPPVFEALFSLPVTGILTLNLDRLATRAFTQNYPGRQLIEFDGGRVGNFSHVLKESSPFIVNLHGTVHDHSSWVFTKKELTLLLRSDAYRSFIKSCLMSRTVVFVGISADDIAVGSHLEALTADGVDMSAHYWITDRNDLATTYWAEEAQIQLIPYTNSDGQHAELLDVVRELNRKRVVDPPAEPVCMERVTRMQKLPPPTELLPLEPEIIRQNLNAHAASILASDGGDEEINYQAYEQFCSEYDEAIYRAWYVSDRTPRNVLFDYTLKEEIADGAFGRVFRASDSTGRNLAIKVLREEVRRKPEMLQSFRRGVRSMRILADREVEGMIPYEEASEIPAAAVMEFVEGPNLQEAATLGFLDDWFAVLNIGAQLASIVRRGHVLPERVLHRDIKPQNVMLRDYYQNPDALDVVLLDFDLSWHVGAQEASVVNQSTFGGFLAPEQVLDDPKMSTRNAAVDSFGLGMTLYYMRTKSEPRYLQHMHLSWEDDLGKIISRFPCKEWESVPVRFARLISNATKHEQQERWDMAQIEGELLQLFEALRLPTQVRSVEFLAEELAQRVVNTGGYSAYEWNADRLAATLRLPSGVALIIGALGSGEQLRIDVEWSNLGENHYKNVRKYLKPAVDQSISALKSKGWRVLPETRLRSAEAGFALVIGAGCVSGALDEHAQEVVNACRRFQF